ncbi:MAG TPA: kelch repeat-containing protein [Gemmatimonadaceae bacterium]|nr:kelch repeat-containing protein [Gemmatimonadaceae bacterium]
MKPTWSAVAAVNVGLALSVAAGGPGCSVFAAGPNQQPSDGSLVQAPAMSAARAAHTATTLPDGRVLVAGGFAQEGSAQGAEVFEPGAGRFSRLPPMITPRHSHTATVLKGGKVLIIGGYGAGTTTLATAEIFDPATDSFAPTGSLLTARANHVAVLLENGSVLVAGGAAPGWNTLASAELYDPATGAFSSTGTMAVAREAHVAARLPDGRVLIAGGHRGRGADITLYSSAETYDPATGIFTRVGDMRVRRHKHDAVLLPNGEVLITGGSDERDDRGSYDSSELFDPETSTFSVGASMRLRRFKHAASSIVLPSGLVLISGGAPQAETYDPLTGRFVLVGGEARMAGQFSAVAPLGSGEALITGGYGNGGGPRSSAWLYRR